jgi:hypothetical protein
MQRFIGTYNDGSVTLPPEALAAAGWRIGDRIRIAIEDGGIMMKKVVEDDPFSEQATR